LQELPDEELRRETAALVEEMAAKRGLTGIHGRVASNDREIAARAIFIAGLVGDPEDTVIVLQQVLGTAHDLSIRLAAVAALGNIGGQKSQLELIALLTTDPDPTVRAAAAHALGGVRLVGTEQALLESLTSETSEAVISDAVEALAYAGSDRSIPAVLTALGHESADVRTSAALAMRSLARFADEPVLDALRVALVRARATADTPEVIEDLQRSIAEIQIAHDGRDG
jgi:HEAT repeat protein